MKILLLQGPLGPFFQALSRQLTEAGHQVVKIHFNGGDASWSCAGDNLSFTAPPAHWRNFLRRLLKQRKIDAVVCYGDCRYYHKVAKTLCNQRRIRFWAMEEGYLRPDFITLECGGVNAHSPWYERRTELAEREWPAPFEAPLTVGPTMGCRARFAMRYYLNKALHHRRYRHYQHHRPWNFFEELWGWVAGAVVKQWHHMTDLRLRNSLATHRGHLFFVPLQVTEDFQIREHSNLSGVEEMVAEVINSFAKYAKPQDVLLFKHHPMDRGFVHYRAQIHRLVNLLGLEGRVFYGYELPLPALYPLLKGVITINSTVGLSALLHKVPTFCMGRALYDLPGLTTQGDLNHFWRRQDPVCEDRFQRFRQSLLHLTQLNASYYRHFEHSAKLVAFNITKI